MIEDTSSLSSDSVEDASRLVGVPDEYQRLWTPHRMAYIAAGPDAHDLECPFCNAPKLSDDEGLIVHRGEHAFVVLNLYPYNTGHVLVCPYRHIAMYDELLDFEAAEIATLTQQVMRVLRHVSGNEGFNIGMNQGKVAGAGVAGHLHQHVVPRWAADSNFMPIIAKTKAMPRLLGDVRTSLAQAWNTV